VHFISYYIEILEENTLRHGVGMMEVRYINYIFHHLNTFVHVNVRDASLCSFDQS
jgi:hypothetical protein